MEIALVYVNIPRKENTSDILSSLRRASENSAENSEQAGYLARGDTAAFTAALLIGIFSNSKGLMRQ